MSYMKRHGMAGMDMGSMSMASATMDMGSTTASMDMGAMSSSTMDMGGMDMDHGMHMYFVGDYLDYPVLFKGLTASNGARHSGYSFFYLSLVYLSEDLTLQANIWNK